jgi:hypothetical protein
MSDRSREHFQAVRAWATIALGPEVELALKRTLKPRAGYAHLDEKLQVGR